MKIALYVIVLLIGLLLCLAAYVRLAPSDPARWHQRIAAGQDADLAGGAIRVVPAGSGDLERVDVAMRALPRTLVLEGSVAASRITYVTRSRLWGFPDYTTVEYGDGVLKLFGRLRFGRSDLGVNAARIGEILTVLER